MTSNAYAGAPVARKQLRVNKQISSNGLPVFSSGQTVHQAAATLVAAWSPDLLVTAGGGVVAHPDGVAAGVEAMCAAYEAAMSGTDAASFAKDHPALATALEAF